MASGQGALVGEVRTQLDKAATEAARGADGVAHALQRDLDKASRAVAAATNTLVTKVGVVALITEGRG